jgi:antitoxin ParD1/3/4
MPTRNVVVTKAQETLIETLLARGRFQNASEIIRAGLRLVEERETVLEEIRAGLKEGLDDLKHGRVREGRAAVNAAFEWAKKQSR